MPDIPGLVPGRVQNDGPGWLGVSAVVEQVEADAGRMAAEDGEVDARTPAMGAEGKWDAGPDGLDLALAQQPFQLCQLLTSVNQTLVALLRIAQSRRLWR
jgi:hypothetical protein